MKSRNLVLSSLPLLTTLLVLATLAAFTPASAFAGVVGVKMNWDVGTLTEGNQTFTLTYHDAHIKIASKGIIQDPPTKIIDGGFGSDSSKVTNVLVGDDTLEVNWDSKAGVTGGTHIGVNFNLDNLGQRNDIRVVQATLTNVSGTSGSASFSGVNFLDIPGPPSIIYGKSNSAAVTLAVSDPALVSPVTFSDVAFYKSAVEPAIESLTAATFGALPKTFLLAVADFSLASGGSTDIEVPGINPPEWLLAHYKTTWTDPTLSAILGGPAEVSVDTWFAGPMVPEPSTFVLAIGGALVIALAYRRRK